jgi:4-amino-4-deoxy-L-arabinose transferase
MVPLAFFVMVRSKLPLYVLPLFVPAAVMAAREIERLNISLYKIRYQIILWCILIVLSRVVVASLPFNQDSSRFAHEIKQRYPYSVEEIIFINTVPAFGLQFYTGSDIKGVSLEFSDLKKEFANNKSRLWLVFLDEREQFLHDTAQHHVQMKELGVISAGKNYAVKNYVLFCEIDDKIQK